MSKSKNANLNPISQRAMQGRLLKLLGVVTPQIYLILLISLYAAHWAWQSNLETLTAIEASHAQQREISLVKNPLTEAELQNALKLLQRLNKQVHMVVADHEGKKALRIEMKDAGDVDAFREALITAQSSVNGVIWTVEYFCMGDCRGQKGVAILTGFTQSIEAK